MKTAMTVGARQRLYADIESGARTIREYHQTAMPGILQTPEFTWSLVELTRSEGEIDYVPERMAEARLQRRRQILRAGGRAYEIILDEVVIRRIGVPPDVLTSQLRHLAETARREPNIVPENGSRGAGRDPHDLDSGVALRRERTIRKLRFACADGRLTLDELVRRPQTTYEATKYDDLQRVTADLPRPGGATVGRVRRGARRLLVGFFGLSGRWLFPALRPRVLAVAAVGEVAIDLRYTPVTSFETKITAIAVLGEVRIVVPPGCQVETDGEFILLGYTRLPAAEGPGTLVPVLRLRTLAVLGDVRVERVE